MTEKKLFSKIYQIAEDLGTDIYIVGGYVRDDLLREKYGSEYDEKFEIKEENRVEAALEKDVIEDDDVEPVIEEFERKEDLDFVVIDSGVEFAEKFDEEFESGSLVLFEEFDTARYVIEKESGGYEIEFAGARKEMYDKGSRKPQVQSATLKEDLSRRDFTVNAMAQQILKDGKLGEVVDHYEGKKDIEKEKLRTPLDPDETFSEDPLRMLRAARFAAKLGFDIEEKTYEAIKENRERMDIVSKERIQEEFLKLMGTPKPSIGLWVLYNTKLINQFLPEVSKLSRKETKQGISHKDNLAHTFEVVDNVAQRTNKPLLRFAALMHDIGKPGTKNFVAGRGWTFDMHEHLGRKIVYEVGNRLRFSKKDTEYVAKLVRWHQQPVQLIMDKDQITDSAVRRLVVELQDDLDDLLKLCRGDITTGNPERKERYQQNYDELEQKIIEVIEKDKLREFQSPVGGDEIMQECSLQPGPTVGKIKDAIEEAILDGKIPNEYSAAKEYMNKIKDKYLEEAEDKELKNK